jgi:hypothetical protein
MGKPTEGWPYTPTQQRILAVLADGKPHRPVDLRECLGDDMAVHSTLRVHIYNLRRLLPPGEAILCEYINRAAWYRHVRLLTPAGTSG